MNQAPQRSKSAYYERCCEQRLQDLILWVSRVFDGQTITGEYVFRNARLYDIAKGSAATQRIVDWCRSELNKRAETIRNAK